MSVSLPHDQVYLRGPGYQLLDEITSWVSLKAIRRRNRVGTWTMELARMIPSGTAGPLVPNPIVPLITKACGIVIRRNGVTIFSGRISTEYTLTATTLRLAGVDDLALLEAPALPNVDGPPYPSAYYVSTGVASSIMRLLVSANIGSSARADRRISNLVFAPDPLLGGTGTIRANFDRIIDVLGTFADSTIAGGLVFTLLQSDTTPNALEFKVAAAVDRTDSVKFSIELGTAADFVDTSAMPGANKVYVILGDGTTGNRTILEDRDAASVDEWGVQRETAIVLGNTTSTSEGNERLAEAMAGVLTSRKVTVTPFQTPALEYLADYTLGDKAQFIVNGQAFPLLITEVQIELVPGEGARITPLVGDAGSTGDDRAAQAIASIEKRLSNVELNFNIPNKSIIPAMIDATDTAQNNEVAVVDTATGQFKWWSLSELAAAGPIASLSVTGGVTVGGTLGVTGAITGSGTVQGTRLISTVATGTAPLVVASQTVVPNLNASLLGGVAAAAFALLAGAAFTGNVSVSGNGLFVDAAANKVRINTASVTGWDLTVGSGGILSEGSVLGTKVAAGASSFSGSEVVRAVGTTRLEGAVTVTTGGIDVTGTVTLRGAVTVTTGDVTLNTGTVNVSAGNVDVQSGTGGQVRAGVLIANAAALSSAGDKLYVNGPSRYTGLLYMAQTGAVMNLVGTSQTQLTVGSSGAASALPGLPRYYLKITFGAEDLVIPVYKAA